MDSPEDEKWTVMIRTMFGGVVAGEYFSELSLEDMIRDADWCDAVEASGGLHHVDLRDQAFLEEPHLLLADTQPVFPRKDLHATLHPSQANR